MKKNGNNSTMSVDDVICPGYYGLFGDKFVRFFMRCLVTIAA